MKLKSREKENEFITIKTQVDNSLIKIRKIIWDSELDVKTKDELIDQSLQCLARLHHISITLLGE